MTGLFCIEDIVSNIHEPKHTHFVFFNILGNSDQNNIELVRIDEGKSKLIMYFNKEWKDVPNQQKWRFHNPEICEFGIEFWVFYLTCFSHFCVFFFVLCRPTKCKAFWRF